MKPAPGAARDLLHLVDHGALGTLLAGEPGQPFVSAMPFAPDVGNAPIFLASALAEHTRNLDRDPRASLLLQMDLPGSDGGVLAQTRMSLVGEARRFEPTAALVERFVRYQPEAERYLALGDFGFFRFHVRRARLIGGFGSMGWLEAGSLAPPTPLSPQREAALLAACGTLAGDGSSLLGVDAEGIDVLREGRRQRLHFSRPFDDTIGERLVAELLGAFR